MIDTPDELDLSLHWQMTSAEQSALLWHLQCWKPKLSIEIGTYKGGSLQAIAKYSDEVISVDIDPKVGQRLGDQFPNTRFVAGDSTIVLPDLVKELNQSGRHADFVLIDGDHSKQGVKRDIEAILSLHPLRQTTVLMHDSFNPDCRAGMLEANWQDSPHVHAVEIDFIPGIYHQHAYDTAAARTMWGGLARVDIRPTQRTGKLTISQSQEGLFDAVHMVSSHKSRSKRRRKHLRGFTDTLDRLLRSSGS